MRIAHWLGVGVLSIVAVSAPAIAQSPPAQPDHQRAAPATPEKKGDGAMMHQNHQKMMADLAAEDARLQELVAAMNAATGEQKVSAIADLVTRLVGDLKNSHRHMMEMHSEMMPHK